MNPAPDPITEAFPELDRVKRFFPLGVAKPQRLSPAQIESFNARGYLCPLDVFDAAEIRAHSAFFDRPGGSGRQGLEQLRHQRLACPAAHPVGSGA